jgi:microcystin degradation protein MlrC
MRVFIATLATETNTFVPFPTGLVDFEEALLVRGSILDEPPGVWTSPVQAWVRCARERSWEVFEGIHAFAEPGGTLAASAFEQLLRELTSRLAACLPVDAILLCMHGAMIAEGHHDCEGDVLAAIRGVAGPAVKIGVELDLHCHLSEAMIAHSTAIVAYKEYPHVDYRERALELFEIIAGAVEGRIRPVMAAYDCRSMGLFPTTYSAAMRDFVDAMTESEQRGEALSLSLCHSFPWADTPDAGVKMLAVTDGDAAGAAALAERFGERFIRIRDEAALSFASVETAIGRARLDAPKPLLLADTSDQVGGGAPGDATHLLRALREQGIFNAAYAPFWDPMATRFCFQAGVGARLRLRIGGKADVSSGAPIDLDIEVMGLYPDTVQAGYNGEEMRVGDLARVATADGTEILLTATRNSIYTPNLFTRHGIDIATKHVLCIKSLYRHTERFRPVTAEMLLVAAPGACHPDWSALPFRRIPRPMWPLDRREAQS